MQAWSVATGEPLQIPNRKRVEAFLPNGIVARETGGRILLQTGETERTVFKSNHLKHCNTIQKILSFTPDGLRLACGFLDGAVRLWDVAAVLAAEDSSVSVHNLAISPDGKWIVSGSRNGTIRIWNPITGDKRTFKQPHALQSIAVSPDGRRLVLKWAGHICFWNFSRGIMGTPDLTITVDIGLFDTKIGYIGFSPDGTYLVVRQDHGSVQIYNSATGEHIEMDIASRVNPVFSPDGCLLATVLPGKTIIRVWDIKNRRLWNNFSLPKFEDSSATLSPGGDKLALGMVSNSAALMWNLETHTVTFTARRSEWLISDKSWPSEAQRIARLLSNDSHAVAAAFSQDQDKLAVIASIDTIDIWDIRGERIQHKINARSCEWSKTEKVSFSPDGDKIAAATKDGTKILLWNFDHRSSFTLYETDVNLVYNIPGESFKEKAVKCVKFLTGNTLFVRRERSARLFIMDILNLRCSQRPRFETNEATMFVQLDVPFNELMFLPDRCMLAIVGEFEWFRWCRLSERFAPVYRGPLIWNTFQNFEFSNPARKEIFSVNLDGNWVCRNDASILYLPEDHRPVRWTADKTRNVCAEMGINYAVGGNTVVIASGDRITVIRFVSSEGR